MALFTRPVLDAWHGHVKYFRRFQKRGWSIQQRANRVVQSETREKERKGNKDSVELVRGFAFTPTIGSHFSRDGRNCRQVAATRFVERCTRLNFEQRKKLNPSSNFLFSFQSHYILFRVNFSCKLRIDSLFHHLSVIRNVIINVSLRLTLLSSHSEGASESPHLTCLLFLLPLNAPIVSRGYFIADVKLPWFRGNKQFQRTRRRGLLPPASYSFPS